jgi:hypothetical protein
MDHTHFSQGVCVPMMEEGRKEATMTLGERCDEIVRLIDETLEDYASASAGLTQTAERPMVAAVRTLARAERSPLARTA